MTETRPATLPISRSAIFDPPGQLRERPPISRLRFVDGHIGWLVTGHAAARDVLADQRFSVRDELRHYAVPRLRASDEDTGLVLPGFFLAMDDPEHARYRRPLIGQFTVRRMNALESKIARIVQGQLDTMLQTGPPADLVQSFALPVTSLMICALLGVPYSEHARFQRQVAVAFRLNATQEEFRAASQSLDDFLTELVARKRVEPDDAIISGLIGTGELTDEEIVGVSEFLLGAGHDTTANMLALGTFALLCHPDQLAVLRADPSLVTGAVEELLRYLTILQFGQIRAALEDVELHGQLIRAGESVCVSLPAANRDPAKFADPDTLDITRSASGHVAFGHGIHQCLGQQLARVEMRVGYAALLRSLPGLRLAVEPQDVPLRSDMTIYGAHQLPITWDAR